MTQLVDVSAINRDIRWDIWNSGSGASYSGPKELHAGTAELVEVGLVGGIELQAGCASGRHSKALPPSMAMTWPVTHPDRSAAKNSTPFAMSDGWPSRRIAMPSTRSRWPRAP